MSSNQDNGPVTSAFSTAALERRSSGPTTARLLGATADDGVPVPSNDNGTPGALSDTTPLAAHPDVVRYIRATLRRYGVVEQDAADAIADVQADSIEAARRRRMPADRAQWKALVAEIAARWAIDRLRETNVRDKYDAGDDDAQAYAPPTLHSEQRDPVDTKKYLAVLGELFESSQMPEHGAEILWGVAEAVPHAEIGEEIDVTETVVRNRLCRMRTTFRTRLAALGLLTILLVLLAVLEAPSGRVAAPDHKSQPSGPARSAPSVPASDAGTRPSENSSSRVR